MIRNKIHIILLVLTLLVFVSWIWSYFYSQQIIYRNETTWGVGLDRGAIAFVRWNQVAYRSSRWEFGFAPSNNESDELYMWDGYHFPGIIIHPTSAKPINRGFFILVQTWLLLAMMSIVTGYTWWKHCRVLRLQEKPAGFPIQ